MSYLLIDGNAIGYAAQHSKSLSVDGREVQAIYGTLRTVRYLRENYPEYPSVLVLWDGRAQWRYDLYPDYKGKRADTEEKVAVKRAYNDQSEDIRFLLNALGIMQAVSPSFEADDLAGLFVRRALRSGKKVRLVTGDEDWLQLVQPGVAWMDPRGKESRHCDFDSFTDYTGYKTPAQFLSAKAIVGDTSDNIKGVTGVGDKSALAIMEHFGSVVSMVQEHRKLGGFESGALPVSLNRVRKRLNALCTNTDGELDVYRRNVQLMNLCTPARDEQMEANVILMRPVKNPLAFQAKCIDLNFFSITRELSRWTTLF